MLNHNGKEQISLSTLSWFHLIFIFIKSGMLFIYFWLPWILAAQQHVDLSSLIRDQTYINNIGRWIVNHWTTRTSLSCPDFRGESLSLTYLLFIFYYVTWFFTSLVLSLYMLVIYSFLYSLQVYLFYLLLWFFSGLKYAYYATNHQEMWKVLRRDNEY